MARESVSLDNTSNCSLLNAPKSILLNSLLKDVSKLPNLEPFSLPVICSSLAIALVGAIPKTPLILSVSQLNFCVSEPSGPNSHKRKPPPAKITEPIFKMTPNVPNSAILKAKIIKVTPSHNFFIRPRKPAILVNAKNIAVPKALIEPIRPAKLKAFIATKVVVNFTQIAVNTSFVYNSNPARPAWIPPNQVAPVVIINAALVSKKTVFNLPKTPIKVNPAAMLKTIPIVFCNVTSNLFAFSVASFAALAIELNVKEPTTISIENNPRCLRINATIAVKP